ncbi:MAG: ABC transporter substrate-binding protein, partial [Acidimicrobiia bacterium]|nr:ABC transporter substrate-binding protein [Acidimicrobiia bacterium]
MRRYSAFLVVSLIAALVPVSLAVGADPAQPTTKAECKKGGWQDFPNAGFRNQGDCIRLVQTGAFVCRDPLGCVSYAEENPLRLATALATSGDVSFLGVDELRAVKIALDAAGPVLGHAIELRNEDSKCNPEGGETAANAIVADPTITAVIGTTCSGAATRAAPIISDAGLSMVSPSNTAPVLTAPDTHAAGYLRVA